MPWYLGAMRQRKLGSHTPPCHRRMVITTYLKGGGGWRQLLICNTRRSFAVCCAEIEDGHSILCCTYGLSQGVGGGTMIQIVHILGFKCLVGMCVLRSGMNNSVVQITIGAVSALFGAIGAVPPKGRVLENIRHMDHRIHCCFAKLLGAPNSSHASSKLNHVCQVPRGTSNLDEHQCN